MTLKDELDKRVAEGLINASTSGHFTLYNYSNHAVFEKAWDEYTLMARGLVLDNQGQVIARPWKKFFNHGERPDDKLPAETPELSHKYDGSMIVAFFDDTQNRWRAVTRGCWENIQTHYAEKWLRKNGARLVPGYTYLFELVAPWNRIVVHYAKEDMILIGIVETTTGKDASYREVREFALERGISGVEFDTKPIESLDLEDPAIKNVEGFVARFSNGYRVKLKYRQYLYLHKIMTGLSIKGIWEILASGNEPDFSAVPDEFMDWYRKQRDRIKGDFERIENEAKKTFQAVGKKESRKEYALEFVKHKELAGTLFRMLDGAPYADTIWKRCRPEIHEVFKVDET